MTAQPKPRGTTSSSDTDGLSAVDATQFDGYTLLGKLGHGGMAEVFLALEEGVGGFRKLVVIKRLHRHLEDEPEMVRMFLDEARLAARLSHPNVVQTNRIGTFGGQHFMVMEYLEGQPLSKLIRRLAKEERTLPPALVARIMSDALDGLHYAHEARDFDGSPLHIVHRDISPQNIFVTYDGGVKLLDFGIAKAATQEAVTHTGLVKGKFAYIAPEQAEADAPALDRRADVWSMGVVLWEALTGRRLFKADNELATLNETLNKLVPKPDRVRPDVPEALADVALAALGRSVDDRYPTAAAMQADVDDWIAASSTRASRSALAGFMRELYDEEITRQRGLIGWRVAKVDAARLGIVDGPLGDLSSLHGEWAQQPEVEEHSLEMTAFAALQHKQRRRGILAGALVVLLTLVAVIAAILVPDGGEVELDAEAVEGLVADDAAPEDEAPTAEAGAAEGTEPAAADAEGAGEPDAEEPASEGEAAAETEVAATTEGPDTSTAAAAPEPRPAAARRVDAPRRPRRRAAAPSRDALVADADATGRLFLNTSPYSVVYLGDLSLGHTPLIGVELPAGTHELLLRNEELGLETTYRVTVPPDGTVRRSVPLE
jgi:serine/threonine protein kinase